MKKRRDVTLTEDGRKHCEVSKYYSQQVLTRALTEKQQKAREMPC